MVGDRFVLISSEIPSSLSVIIKKISGMDNYTCVTATKISDTLQLSSSLKPNLIILYFREPKYILQSLSTYHDIENVPILCLTHKFQSIDVVFKEGMFMFLQSYEDALLKNNLRNNVRILLRLSKKAKLGQEKKETKGFASIKSGYSKYNKNLARYTLELDQKQAVLQNIRQKIKELCIQADKATKLKLVSLLNTIKISSSGSSHWEDFKAYFEEINPHYVKTLSNNFPKLTSKDIKYCCYLKMNMSNEDIRNILGINQESVRTHKYRLKKKLTLSKEQSLRNFLQTFSV